MIRNTWAYKAALAEQEAQVDYLKVAREHMEHAKRTREMLEEFHDLLDHRFNPRIKIFGVTLSYTGGEIIVRREERLYYAICPSAQCNIAVNYSQGSRTVMNVVGWTPVVLPDGAMLTLATGATADVPCLVMLSNVALIIAATNVI